ncbi:MAG: paraquat-inducible membrane protein A [Verrucomicrobiaceae bacterium]|nr:MAG: paraquat-inducible membrane protein A [Verrucomicrobiaceae bacterium]
MSAPFPKAADRGLACCRTCGKVSPVALGHCPRCGTSLHLRKPASLEGTVALMIAAGALYIPSHLLPIMTTVEIGVVTHHTIIGGMMTFWETGAYPIAIVIFTASILIPFLRIAALSWLCAAASGKMHPSPEALGRVYLVTELLGRWSMIDIFVVGIMVSVVQLGNYMAVTPGPGALAFAGVVVLTMFAAMRFEPRLLWDRLDEMNTEAAPASPTTIES